MSLIENKFYCLLLQFGGLLIICNLKYRICSLQFIIDWEAERALTDKCSRKALSTELLAESLKHCDFYWAEKKNCNNNFIKTFIKVDKL